MPSLYLTKYNSGKPLPAFAQKKIADQMPGVVGDVPVTIISPFYAIPAQLFKYIFYAIAANVVVDTTVELYHNLFKPITALTRLYEVPVCTFRFKNLGPVEIAELKGMGLQQDQTNSNLFVGTPASHNLATIYNLGPIDDRIRPGHLTFEGYFAWVFLMKGVQAFTTAKNTMVKKGFNTLMDTALSIPKSGSGGIARIDGDRMDYVNKFNEAVGAYSGSFVLAPPTNDMSTFPGSVKDINADLRFGEGIFFPYFNGMNTSDKDTAFLVFQRIFEGSLAVEKDKDVAMMAKIRVGIRQLAFSRSGMALSHIYKCISLANEVCGAKMHVIVKGNTYVGTVIEGSFEVRMYGKKVVSGDVSEDLKGVNLLDGQAQKVCDLANSAVDGNDAQIYHFTKDDFLTSRRALRNFNSIEPSVFGSSSLMTNMRDILESMEFDDMFPVPDQDLLLKAVSFMSTGDFASISDTPAYLGGGVLHKNSRVFEALSMFGPRAPSCNTGDNKGTVITFPALGKEDTNIVRVNGVRPLGYFPFQLLPLNVACSQWESMISKGIVCIPKGRKGKKEFTDLHRVAFTVSSDPAFTTMYGLIKGMANDAREAGKMTGKRKRDNDGGEAKDGKRQKGKAQEFDL